MLDLAKIFAKIEKVALEVYLYLRGGSVVGAITLRRKSIHAYQTTQALK